MGFSVVTQSPEAQAALARAGKPWDVEDPELAARIKAEYNRLSVADTAARIEPLVKSKPHVLQSNLYSMSAKEISTNPPRTPKSSIKRDGSFPSST